MVVWVLPELYKIYTNTYGMQLFFMQVIRIIHSLESCPIQSTIHTLSPSSRYSNWTPKPCPVICKAIFKSFTCHFHRCPHAGQLRGRRGHRCAHQHNDHGLAIGISIISTTHCQQLYQLHQHTLVSITHWRGTHRCPTCGWNAQYRSIQCKSYI